MNTLVCQNEERREAVRRNQRLNGLDYLEVESAGACADGKSDQRKLVAHFLGKAPVELDKPNVVIEGGRRIRNIRVLSVTLHRFEMAELDDFMEVVVDRAGDFSPYTLRVVERDERGRPLPHPDFDPRYDRLQFDFKVDCPSDLDCQPQPACPPEFREEPEISYLAKDYASFRRLILDRLALVMPEWQERLIPDLGITLVELLAYTGDYLSYYQDAVATEAYLETARQRISVRRHVKLVDYRMHEGCNARAWLYIETIGNLELDPRDTYFIAVLDELLPPVLSHDDLSGVLGDRYEVFEPVTGQTIKLYGEHNRIEFYTWGDQECCLPRGATSATLKGELAEDAAPTEPPACDPSAQAERGERAKYDSTDRAATPALHLEPGDVLIFEEVIGPKTNNPADADPRHRHVVRLTRVEAGVDPLNQQPVVEIEWAEADALPFPLCLSALGPAPDCTVIENISVARGNVILVDHGRRIEEGPGTVEAKEIIERCHSEGVLSDTEVVPERFQPALAKAPLTFSHPLAPGTPASQSLAQDPRMALPQIKLTSTPGDQSWRPQYDLLASRSGDWHFVAEMDNDGRAHLRFGDGELGRRPEAGLAFHAEYRVGNGTAGNTGAETITHIVTRKTTISGGIRSLRNPIAATGGVQPEPLAEARLFAPHVFRKDLQRAITAEDYARIVEREFKTDVQRAAAQLAWNGSWYEAIVAVDPLGREEAGAALLERIAGRLYRYRRMGHDLSVRSARRVPVYIKMIVCVLPDLLRGHVRAALLGLFSSRVLAGGRRGYFHPDNLTFGEGLLLSRLVAAAQGVEGVESVKVEKLERQFEGPHGEIEAGVLKLSPFEIVQLDNDPSFPEHGLLELVVRGGR
jgi:hypothetical protein